MSAEGKTWVRAVFERKLYKGSDNGFCIFKYRLEDSEQPPPLDSVGMDNTFTAKGHLLPEESAMTLKMTGGWTYNEKFGKMDFNVEEYAEEYPETEEGIVSYLGSGLFAGIGPAIAKNIYAAFGDKSIDILTSDTNRLKEVKGIGKAKVAGIIESVKATVEIQDLVRLLSPYGISLSQIRKIKVEFEEKYSHFGDAVEAIKEEPFRLCEIKGFGFATVDSIAAKFGTPLDSPLRVKFAMDEVFNAAGGREGHLYLTDDKMMRDGMNLLNKRAAPGDEVSYGHVKQIMNSLTALGEFAADTDLKGAKIVYRKWDYINECSAARSLREIAGGFLDKRRRFSQSQLDKLIAESEREFGLDLAPKQVEAIKMALTNKVSVITGGPGTGKTTILRFLLRLYESNITKNYSSAENDRPSVLLMAPTGKAARRMSESTGQAASTIHSAMGIGIHGGGKGDDFENDDAEKDAPRAGIYFIDESSMIDMSLMSKLLDKIPVDAQVVFIGDIDQLPSVGAGAVLGELIASRVLSVVKLDVIYRQGETSLIIKNAHKIREGKTGKDDGVEFHRSEMAFIPVPFTNKPNVKRGVPADIEVDPQADMKLLDSLKDLYFRAAKKYGLKETQILCPRRAGVTISSDEINIYIQAAIFEQKAVHFVKVGFQKFYVGDRIIQTRNTPGPKNGDMGIITNLRVNPENPDNPDDFIVDIGFDYMEDGKFESYSRDDMKDVSLGYAISIHKSQGSEFRAVFIPILWSQCGMLQRNLLYTGVTRSKEFVAIFGQALALNKAIKTENAKKRNTLFAVRLRRAFGVSEEDEN